MLELRYVVGWNGHMVCRKAIGSGDAGNTHQDVHYGEFRATVELDGRLGHADLSSRWRDMRRDNASTLRGESTLRFGWADVTSHPCTVAAQVAAVLRAAGWRGAPQTCGPSCTVAAQWSRFSVP